MKSPLRTTKLLLVLTMTLTMLGSAFFLPMQVAADDLQQQLDEVERRIADIVKEKQDIQARVDQYNSEASGYHAEASALSGEIALLDNEIAEIQARIDQLNLSIQILEEEIETNEAIITQLEYDAETMQVEVDSRILNMYLEYKTGLNEAPVEASLDNDEMFKKQQYKEVMVNQTKKLVEELNDKLDELESQKVKLEDDKISLERDIQLVEEKQHSLASKKTELDAQRQAFYRMQSEALARGELAQTEIVALNEAEAEAQIQAADLRAQIIESVGSVPNGSFVRAGTIIGFQGNTGVSFGHHLHFEVSVGGQSINPCARLPSGLLGSCYGNGELRWPLQSGFYYTSAYGNRCYTAYGQTYCRWHNGIDLAHPQDDAAIYAAHDGWLTKGFWSGCYAGAPICNHGGTYYAIICEDRYNCNNGIKSSYLHLDPKSL